MLNEFKITYISFFQDKKKKGKMIAVGEGELNHSFYQNIIISFMYISG